MLVKEGVHSTEVDDVFYFPRRAMRSTRCSSTSYMGWAVNAPIAGPTYWPPKIARRREIVAKLRELEAAEARSGEAPTDRVTEPFYDHAVGHHQRVG